MNLLHIITTMDPRSGGPCQGIRNLTLLMSEQGHTVEVVCLDDPGSDYLLKDTFRVHALGRSRGRWGYHPLLRSWLNDHLPRFDAVILNGLWQYPGYLLSKVTQQSNMPPYFVYPHGMLDPWFQRAPGRRLKAVRNWFFWKLVENKVITKARAIFFTCAEEMRLARDTFRPYEPKREINVGFGVCRPPVFHASMQEAFVQKCSGVQEKPYFLFLSRIHPKKGVDILIRAYAEIYFSSLATRHSVPRLVIAGPGLETDYGKEMQKLAGNLCAPDSVLWPGMLTGDAKWGALYGAEAFALTSHQENFGIAVVEALACGTPVLISNQINIWHEIVEARGGLAGDDTVGGAKQMFRQWEGLSPENRAVMKKSAFACYENHFSIAMATQNLLATMEELTGNSRGQEQISKNA